MWPDSLLPPPATSTLPLNNNVAVKNSRFTFMEPVVIHFPVAGSYSSAELVTPAAVEPPATSTLPLDSSVAVWDARATFMGELVVQTAASHCVTHRNVARIPI